MNRLHTVTEKIEREDTGLAGGLFVHVNFGPLGGVDSVRFSHKQKDDSTLDKILVALGDAITRIIHNDSAGGTD